MAMDRDGLITFESSYQALRAERAVQNAGVEGRLVPAPRDLSPTCVVALRFPWEMAQAVPHLLNKLQIEFDQCCCYPERLPHGWTN